MLNNLLKLHHIGETQAKLDALDRSQAIIEFTLGGTIITANAIFLKTMGYSLEEIKGKHHSIFVEKDYAQSSEYRNFWASLKQGNFQSAEFPRLNKQGEQVWMQATYTPLLNRSGKPYKVIKFASDITEQKRQSADYQEQIKAISKSQAVIEFNMNGTIITANDNFLNAMGYTLAEIKNQHHAMFVEPAYKSSAEYRNFWQMLNAGKHQTGEYCRLGKGGKEVWIQASYNPIFDLSGKPFKVVKYATDVTQEKLNNAYYTGQVASIEKAQAVIEFEMDGTIIKANDNFLHVMGYTLDEIKGQHHSIFVDSNERNSAEYKSFWTSLNQGKFQIAEYKRYGKNQKEIWVQASYNPIFNAKGKPFRVVKYATDITQQKLQNADFNGQVSAIDKSQAVIEFSMDGTIIRANDNFLNTMGYTLDEIKGKNHKIFVEPSYANSSEYQSFWETLNSGQFQAAEYKRLGKNNKEIWIQASYNPIFDLNGKPFKVVKYATDITAKKFALNKISSSLLALSDGDLSCFIDDDLEGDFSVLKDSMNTTLARLRDMVRDITDSARNVASNSREIESASINLSERTESQAASLEETSASLEELTAAVNQNADNAKNLNTLSAKASSTAKEGGHTVSQAIIAMENIQASSNKIADIINVINEIAFQTNLLALNAAVEAARAGEQGRGFAVVAGEVRNLAQRSAGAAKEIQQLITESVEKVSQGTEMANKSGIQLSDIVTAIEEVSTLIVDITTASQEQAAGILQVSDSVSEMDNMTQKNAAMVEETSSSSMAMAKEAESLLKLVQFFKE